ncbi:MAG: hypothetical protein WA172_10775 [Terriglobales bacterium]
MSAVGAKRGQSGKLISIESKLSNLRSVVQQSLSVYFIDTANRFVSVKFTKRLTFGDIENYASALCADPQFDSAFSEVVDLREVKEVALSTEELIALADRVDPFSPRARRAFVAHSPAQINAAQLHRILRPEAGNVRVFFSMDEAEQWIAAGS